MNADRNGWTQMDTEGRGENRSDRRRQLLDRLDAIGASLARTPGALALLGLGSVGLELDRLDEHSDLDFFVVVEAGCKARFLDSLDWLEAGHPIAYAYRNTVDGSSALFADGIFLEMAVFEPHELAAIPFAPGRVVWQQPGVDAAALAPSPLGRLPEERSLEWLLGEALTNLYVGLSRERRGERLSAVRRIQGNAVDRVVELAARVEQAQPAQRDLFTGERRFEARFPGVAQSLPAFVQGYARNRESAAAILDFLEAHFPVNAAMAAAVRRLL
jgi:hypothetical protein